MDWPERLSKLFEDRNLAAVAKRLGFTKNRLYSIAREGKCPNAVDAVRICRYLGLSVEEVFGESEPPGGGAAASWEKWRPGRGLVAYSLPSGRYRGAKTFKLIGQTKVVDGEDGGREGLVPVLAPVAAGEPQEAHDLDFPAGRAEAFVAFSVADPNAFALQVDGDSMAPDFGHGDLIIASPKLALGEGVPRDGILAVAIWGSEWVASFKVVRWGKLRREKPVDYMLLPINEKYPRFRVRAEELYAVHPVVGVVKAGQ